MYERREYRQLSDDERQRYMDAVVAIADTIVDPEVDAVTSQYDLFVRMHQPQTAVSAHGGPGFQPWHREFLMRFESALQQIDPNVTLPYCDSPLDHALPVPEDSVLWDDDCVGNNWGNVTTGTSPALSCGSTVFRNQFRCFVTSFLIISTGTSRALSYVTLSM